MERVQKIIASAGICSRRKAEDLIIAGKVTVNDEIITIGTSADSEKDTITVNGKVIEKEPKVYYLLNKPKGYITTNADMFDRKKVADLLPRKPRVFPVGRLDRYATGILIITNDGEFANSIMHPKFEVKKTYVVILDKPFQIKQIDILKKGVGIDKHQVRADVVILDKNIVAITLHVGINKIVKRLFKKLGYYVKKLHRTHIGNLAVDIPEKEFRVLTKNDKKKIFEKPNITKRTFFEY